MAPVTSDKVKFRMRNIVRNQEGHLVMRKESGGHKSHKYINIFKTVFENT